MKKVNLSLAKLAPMIEKIERLSKVQRILIYSGTFLILIGAFVYFSYIPKFKTIGKLQESYAKVEKDLEAAKRNAKQLNSYRNKMKKAEAQFMIVSKALPEKKEIPSLLAAVSKSGQDAGLEFLLFQPKPEINQDFYAEIPVSIQVIGNYHNVAVFFDQVARMSRIVNIKDISMRPAADGIRLDTSCTAVTYKFLEQGKKKDKGDKGKTSKKSKKKKKK
jgi:type IV pilus assembly protein PilO